jgi:ferredoxin
VKVMVDRSRCIGASLCVVTAPRVFLIDGARKAFVVDAAGADAETLRRAAAICPTGAIRIESDEGGGPGRPAPPDEPA